MPKAELQADFGIVGDAHAGNWHRQVSLLGVESIGKMVPKGAKVSPGNFAENITTEGIDLLALKVGSKLRLGNDVELEITQFGKKCHAKCEIFEQIGDCIIMGLGAALREEMRLQDGKILNAGFAGYLVPRFTDVPKIDVHLINKTDIPSAGGGETPIIAIAPAIANAVFTATGLRIRFMPIRFDA